MFKRFLFLLACVGIFLFGFYYIAGIAQISNPSSVDFPIASYQITDGNLIGTALEWSGWNRSKWSYLNKPIQVNVKVESVNDTLAGFYYTVDYFDRNYSQYHNGTTFTPFWIPDSAGIDDSEVPDSLFYIVPDSTGMAAGDEFYIHNTRIKQGDQYTFRLIFPTNISRGTATVTSQPIWIGFGVSSMVFGYNPVDTMALVYRTLYSTSHSGFYSFYISSDTLADSCWTIDSTEADAWNYKSITGIDDMSWMKIERIGKSAADTLVVEGEILIIQSE